MYQFVVIVHRLVEYVRALNWHAQQRLVHFLNIFKVITNFSDKCIYHSLIEFIFIDVTVYCFNFIEKFVFKRFFEIFFKLLSAFIVDSQLLIGLIKICSFVCLAAHIFAVSKSWREVEVRCSLRTIQPRAAQITSLFPFELHSRVNGYLSFDFMHRRVIIC